MQMPMPLILASQSPRRRQLMHQYGYKFAIDPPDDDAESGEVPNELPADLVRRFAIQKAENVALRYPSGLIIGCDTVAECDGEVLGKPIDREHAREMLMKMRGRTHRVLSGLCLWRRPDDRTWTDVVSTRLTMSPLSEVQIDEYLANEAAWRGKAGAFGFQDGLDWVQIDEGSESNVVGLPMECLKARLEEITRGESS